jgi:diguanylate cyclase (GGDEF)-like protein
VLFLLADSRHVQECPRSRDQLTRLVIFVTLGWAVAKLRDDRIELRRLNRRLEGLLSHEAGLARTDTLTGLANSRAFLEDLAALSTGRFVIAYIDLDNFKRVNDGFGHAAGDNVLQQVGQCLAGSLRERDSSARLGGDEFAVLLRDVAPDDAEVAVRRLVQRIAEIGHGYPGAALGASAGLALFESHPGAEAALRAADHAMYQAKQAGKSRVIVTRPGV